MSNPDPKPSPDPNLVDLILHSTGMGLDPGDSDPNWLVALGPAGFPRLQAQVCYLQEHDRGPGKWVWFNPDGSGGLHDQIYVFRNTIDLSNFEEPEEAFGFTLSARAATPILVAANGHRVHHRDAGDEAGALDHAEPGHVFKADYEIPKHRLKRQVNTVDVIVRATDSGPAGIRVGYDGARGRYAPPAAQVILDVASADGRADGPPASPGPIRIIARIPQPPTPGRTFQDLTINLNQTVSEMKKATVTLQIVTLDDATEAIPVGASQVYDSSHSPTSILTGRVLGFSGAKDAVYVRISSHSVVGFDDPTGQPTRLAEDRARGKMGDPPSWPPNSGVVVVVADSSNDPAA